MSRARSGSATFGASGTKEAKPLLRNSNELGLVVNEVPEASSCCTDGAPEDGDFSHINLTLHDEAPPTQALLIDPKDMMKGIVQPVGTPLVRTVAAANVLTPLKTAMSLLKCVVGAGSFILPSAVKDAGLVLGFVSLLILGLASAYTINQLALAGRIVAKANPNRRVPTYVDVGRAIIGEWTKPITYFGVVATLIGVCAVYLDFIGQMLSDVIDNKLTVKEVQAVLIAPLILLSWLRNFKWLAWTSIVGDIAVVCGVIVVLAYGWYHHGIVSPTKLPAANLSSYSQFFGQSVFLFAVHTVILPLSQAMREPRRFSWVVNVSFFWIVIINALFGAFGYMIFRDETKGMVLDNVQGKVVSKFVKVLLAVDLFFTVPIVLSAPRRLIERSFIAEGDPYTTLKENLIRSGCVAVFAGLAFLVPNINDLATLVGGMVSPLMGFILPPIFYLRLFKGKLSQLTVMLNWILIVFGTFAGIFTTIQQIRSMA